MPETRRPIASPPLLVKALIAVMIAVHVIWVIGPTDVLWPVDPWVVGRRLWRGEIPYLDFQFEYPPLAAAAFLLPGAVPHGLALSTLALQAVAAEAAVIWLVLRKVDGAVLRWCGLSILLFPFLSGGFDALAVAAIAISTALLAVADARGWWVAAAGALIKLSPGAAWVWGRTRLKMAAIALAVTLPLLLLPALLVDDPLDSYVGYSIERGVQVESVAATTAWVADGLAGEPSTFEYRFRSWEINGASAAATAWAVMALAGLALVAWRARGVDPWLLSFTAVTVLLIGSKVLSPQFIAWPAPLAAVLGGRWFLGWLGVAALTMLAYVVGSGPGSILAITLVRNLLLVGVAAAGLRAIWNTTRTDH